MIDENEMNDTSPQIVREPFLNKRSLMSKFNPFNWFGNSNNIQKELNEPLLFLMKENGYMEILENVRAGEFIINSPSGEKCIMLTPDKITTLKYGNEYYKTWVAYENCATPYPENPLHTSEMFRKITQKLAMNWRDRDESKLLAIKGKFWLYILGGIGLLIILAYSADPNFISNLISGGGDIVSNTVTGGSNNTGEVTIQ